MRVEKVTGDCQFIADWSSFHEAFARVFGFPAFYGKNMSAWIDCMTSIDSPDDGMSDLPCVRGGVLTLELRNVVAFKKRCREQYEALIDGAAFVNWRRVEMGDPAVLALSFYR